MLFLVIITKQRHIQNPKKHLRLNFQHLIVFSVFIKTFILDVRQGSEYTSFKSTATPPTTPNKIMYFTTFTLSRCTKNRAFLLEFFSSILTKILASALTYRNNFEKKSLFVYKQTLKSSFQMWANAGWGAGRWAMPPPGAEVSLVPPCFRGS